MASSNTKYGRADKLDLINFFVGVQRKVLTENYTFKSEDPVTTFFDPNGADRDVTLPAVSRGLYFVVFNVGSANQIVVKDNNGVVMISLSHVEGAQLFCSGTEWRYLAGVSASTLAAELQSADTTVTITQPTPAVVDLAVNEAAVDHNLLFNYVADQHIAHSGVTLTAGVGLAGGGTIAASRTFDLDLNDLTSDTPTLSDTFAFYDVSGSDTNKATLTVLNSILDHNSLLNYVANQHIDHTTVSISAGTGLTGGGTIAASRTLSLDINGLVADTPVSTDFLVFYDVSGGDHNKVTIANLFAAVVAPGSDKQVLFNNSGAFGAAAHLLYNSATSVLTPDANDALALGTTALSFSDLFLASGAVINFNAGNLTLTHSAGVLTLAGAYTITSTSATALAVGRQGTTTPVLTVDASTLSNVTGLKITGAAASARLALAVTSSVADEGLSVDAKGAGTIRLGATSTGAVEFSRAAQPTVNDGVALGASGTAWSDVFLATGGVLNWNAGNYTITHSAGDLAFSGIITLPNSGLHVLDTNASHDLIITPGSDLTADRILTLTTGDAARTVTISGNATISQDYSTTGNPQFATIELGAATDTTLSRSSAGNVAIEGNVIYRAGGTDVPVTDGGTGASDAATARTNLGVPYGKQSIWVPAVAMVSRTTNGAATGTVEATTNKNMIKTLDFDSATQEFAQFDIRMPKSWDESTVTFIPVWSHPATVTNFGVVWGLDAVAISDDDTLDVAFGTAQTSTDTGGTTNDSYQGPESSAITVSGTPAAGDLVQYRIHRDPANGSDTMAVDARLHGILLLYTNDTTSDT